MSAATAPTPTRPRREPELTFLRLVPGTSPVHRLWAGTKLVVAAELALLVSIAPTWAMLGGAAAVVGLGLLVARIPLGAFPRLPDWFYWLLLIGAGLSLLSGTHPVVEVAHVSVSLGGLAEWARFTALAIVLITSGALIGWTTPLGEVAPALSTLARPLRWFRLPVAEWVVATALAIRCLPLLIDEIRTLGAARRLRTRHEDARPEPSRTVFRELVLEAHDLMATAIVASIRRARDLGDAIVARGGLHGGVSADRSRLRASDWTVLLLATAATAGALAVLYL